MSGKRRWLRSHVEQLLQDEWNRCRVRPDDDGDYAFRCGTAACWVSLLFDPRPMVRITAHAALDVKPSVGLFRELNAIQLRALSASVCLDDGTVVVSQTLDAHGLTKTSLHQALNAVGGVADDIGTLLAGMFDGHTPYPAEPTTVDEQAS
ncbi:MAG TPA: YbjN domain-containing protein [Jatrophihabitantaceae bacterium]|nr:YbjN domain-containing protein [Jatrophihabitantaceae bacterium]